MQDLRSMAVFAAVVDAGSFSGAARELGITRSAVSRHVQLLEERHGVQLMHRTTRSLRLTDAGATFHEGCAELVRAAREAIDGLGETRGGVHGTIRVSAPIGLGEHYLAPTLPAFLARHPRVSVEVVLDDALVNLVSEGYDLALRGGALADSSLIARKLAPLELVVCASRRYLRSHAAPSAPRDLLEHSWIGYLALGDPQRVTFMRDGRRKTVRPVGRVKTNNGEVIRTLVRAGAGIGLLPRFYIAEDLKRGSLVQLLPEHEVRGGAVYAVYPPARFVPPKVRAFVDFLAESAR